MTSLIAFGAIVLAIIGFLVWAYIQGRRAGGTAVTAKVATKTVEVQQRMDEAAAKTDPTKAGVKKSLEDGTF